MKHDLLASKQAGRNYSISAIRLISLLLIITCHILQYFGNELAWWFNVGVQIFLCISGFLYGQKPVGDIKNFCLHRFKKICVPFYIVLVPAIVINLVVNNIQLLKAVRALLMNTTFPGAGHLWFVPTILFCYAITPILEVFYTQVSRKKYIIISLLTIEIFALFCFAFARFYNGAWIGCYAIGYALGVNEKKEILSKKVLLVLFGVLSCFNIIQIYNDYIVKIELSGITGEVYRIFKDYNHVWLGVFLFIALKTIFDKIAFSKKIELALDTTDKYSYETYLVHQFIILGPFSLMALTPCLSINIFFIVICRGNQDLPSGQ